MSGFIYKISTTKTNKVYIGKTTKTIEKRFKEHINNALNNNTTYKLSSAIRKYGVDTFKVELIDTADTPEELALKEIY